MTVELLLDTNAAIAWMKDDVDIFRALPPTLTHAITLISIGELEFGAAKSVRVEANRQRLASALAPFRRVALDDSTPRIYGDLQTALRRKGRPIPTNDIWIAALALQHGLPLLTRDAHFKEVDGLDVRTW